MHDAKRATKLTALLAAAAVALIGGGFSAQPAWAADGDAVAIVNGRPITKRKVVDVLMEAHGLQIMQQLIVLELAKGETRRLKIRVTRDDIDREFEHALARIAPESDAHGEKLDEPDKQQALEMLLQQRGITMAEFKIGMERNAHLRKVIEKSFRVDEATLREEYARMYGEKVEIRHIQVGDIEGLHEALNLLEKQTDFAEVARRVSQNAETAAEGGLLPPFAFNDDKIAPLLREAAFALGAGEVSKPIKVGRWFHILKLERRLSPNDVWFDDVRDEVERSLRNRAIPQEMRQLIGKLFRKASVRVLDSDLREQYENLLKDNAFADPTLAP